MKTQHILIFVGIIAAFLVAKKFLFKPKAEQDNDTSSGGGGGGGGSSGGGAGPSIIKPNPNTTIITGGNTRPFDRSRLRKTIVRQTVARVKGGR